jgi:hypothetical protein
VCFMSSDMTLHSLRMKVVTVDHEVHMHFSILVHWSVGNLTLLYTY